MLNNEKTIRFEDFAAVSQDGGDVLGKVLYYSLSSILIDRSGRSGPSALRFMGWVTGLEPATLGTTIRCSTN